MATTNIGQVSIVPMGAFNLGTAYKRLSVVTYNGSSYIAKQDNQNIAITNTAYWYLLASKGDQGDTYEVTPADLQAIADQITSDASSAFNQNVTEKTEAFDNHVTSKTNDFDTNAGNKTTAFNNNATNKTTDFNTNATNKTTDFNTNATNKTNDFNTNASDKTTAFNSNASDKIDYYNANADEVITMNEQLLDQIPRATVTGTSINVTDSSNLPIADIQVQGNASQATTSIAGGDEYDSPTPDHPQPISVVTGDNTVKVIGKNLYNGEYSAGKGINSSGAEYNSAGQNASKHIAVIPNTTYTLNMPAKIYALARYKKDKTFISRTVPGDITTLTFTVPEDCYSIRFSGYDENWSNVQLELGSTATAYEPYTERTQLLSLGTMELAKIGDYEDKIFIAKVGDETYDSLTSEQKATLTLGKWYKYGAVGKYSYNNDLSTNGLTEEQVQFLTPALNVAPNSATADLAFCNLLTSTLVNKTGLGGATGTSKIRIMVSTTYGTTYEAIRTIFSQNNLTIYYQLATPTITEITDTTLVGQLDSLLAMKTNRNITNMFTATDNETPTLAVLYRQDLTTLFNNLTSAILSLGNNT